MRCLALALCLSACTGSQPYRELPAATDDMQQLAMDPDIASTAIASAAAVHQLLKDNGGSFEECFFLTPGQTSGGKITLQWYIDAHGTVQTPSILEATPRDERIEQCLLNLVKTLAYPTSGGTGAYKMTHVFVEP